MIAIINYSQDLVNFSCIKFATIIYLSIDMKYNKFK